MHIKRFTDRKRFDAELANYNHFKELGFAVPIRFSVTTDTMVIEYEKLNGVTANLSDANKIIETLNEIQIKTAGIYANTNVNSFAFEKYEKDIECACAYYGLCSPLISKLIEDNFFPTVFRDARPENWIISPDGKVYIIDFDYVVSSGPLQDFSQFVSGLWISDESLVDDMYIFSGLDYLTCFDPWRKLSRMKYSDLRVFCAASILLSLFKKRNFVHYMGRERRISSLVDVVSTYFQKL